MSDSTYLFRREQMTRMLMLGREPLPEAPARPEDLPSLLLQWLAQPLPLSPVDPRSMVSLVELDPQQSQMLHAYQHLLLKDVLLCDSCEQELFVLLKEYLKTRMPLEDDDLTQQVIHTLYYLCIAHCLVFHDECITSLSFQDIRGSLLALTDALDSLREIGPFLLRALDLRQGLQRLQQRGLYQANMFHLLGLAQSAPLADLEARHAKAKRQCRFLGTIDPGGWWNHRQTDEQRAGILTSLAEDIGSPVARWIHAQFAFPAHIAGKPLEAWSDSVRGIRSALPRWIQAESGSSPSSPDGLQQALAIGYHALAVDFEARLDSGEQLSPHQQAVWRECWKEALARWHRWSQSPDAQSHAVALATSLQDPRYTADWAVQMFETVRAFLPELNVYFGLQATLRGMPERLDLHVQILRDSPCDLDSIQAAVYRVMEGRRLTFETYGNRLTDGVTRAPETGVAATRTFLTETRPFLTLLDRFLPAHDMVCESWHDQVATTALNAQIDYGNATQDWTEPVSMLRQLLLIARSDSVRGRLRENLEVAENNQALANRAGR